MAEYAGLRIDHSALGGSPAGGLVPLDKVEGVVKRHFSCGGARAPLARQRH
jgi:hypothetical protein